MLITLHRRCLQSSFMWVDKHGNWHIINHAYANSEYEQCGRSIVSAHFFSSDGKTWNIKPDVQPYGHTVQVRLTLRTPCFLAPHSPAAVYQV